MIHLVQNTGCLVEVDEQSRVQLTPQALAVLGVGPGGKVEILLDQHCGRVLLQASVGPVQYNQAKG